MSTNLLSQADLDRIKSAVDDAEKMTAGEIVPYVVNRSGRYEIALWRGAGMGSLLAAVVGLLVAWTYDGWGLGWLYSAWGMVLLMTFGGIAGALLAHFVPALKRLLVGSDRLANRTHKRAESAFLEEEVFQTRDRTGILLFISMFEHRIEVIGDVGINQAVEQEEWNEVVDRIRRGIVGGKLADGMIDAIKMCGELLQKRGVGIRDDDEDEISDDVRVRDE